MNFNDWFATKSFNCAQKIRAQTRYKMYQQKGVGKSYIFNMYMYKKAFALNNITDIP